MDDLFFVLSKVLWIAAKPESWFGLLLALALVAAAKNRLRLTIGFLSLCLAAYAVIAVFPVADLLYAPLESRFPVRPAIGDPAYIVVLGGAEDLEQSAATGMVNVNQAAERLLAAIEMARTHPDAQLILSGSSGSLLGTSVSSAEVMAQALAGAGIERKRLLLETVSRNTAENAQRSAELAGDGVRRQMVLVTSAFHMPRSIGLFCRAGWSEIIPYPVDFRSSGGRRLLGWAFADNLDALNTAVREWIGLVAYWLTGRTKHLFPGGC